MSSTLDTLSCLVFKFAWADLSDLKLWPKGELFTHLGNLDAFRHPKVSRLAVKSVVNGESRCFSYFGQLSFLVCLDKFA